MFCYTQITFLHILYLHSCEMVSILGLVLLHFFNDFVLLGFKPNPWWKTWTLCCKSGRGSLFQIVLWLYHREIQVHNHMDKYINWWVYEHASMDCTSSLFILYLTEKKKDSAFGLTFDLSSNIAMVRYPTIIFTKYWLDSCMDII